SPPVQTQIRRNRQRKAKFRCLGPDEPASQRLIGLLIVRTGATGLKAAQIVAAQEETVDDFLFAARQQNHVAGARPDLDAPIRVAELSFQWNVVGPVQIAS